MKKTITALVIGMICAASTVQAEDGAMYECTEDYMTRPTITLGKHWVEMYGKRFKARYQEIGIYEVWKIGDTDQTFAINPELSGYFTNIKGTERLGFNRIGRPEFWMQCEPVE